MPVRRYPPASVGRVDPHRESGHRARRAALGLFIAAAILGAASSAPAQTPPPEPPYKFSGLVFGDYYYFSQDHSAKWEGQQGFWIRRVYFTFDYTFSPRITSRLRLEMNSNGKLDGGLLTPYIKDAYLRWRFYGRQNLTVGMHPSLSLEFVDTYWGLRHIEKTPLDLYRWDSTRDTGLLLSGPLNRSGTVKYGVQFGNDSGTGSETDRYKAVRAVVRFEGTSGLTIEGNGGYFARDKEADRGLAHVLAGYKGTWGRVGAEYAHQTRKPAAGTPSPALGLDVYSGFIVSEVKPQKLSVFARVDRHDDPCPDCAGIDYLPIDSTAKFTLLLAGVEYYVAPSVRFSPNVEWVSYSAPADAATAKPKDDLVWRATFYWVW